MEAEEPLQSLSATQLSAIAKGVASSAAFLYKGIKTCSSEGRFSVKCYGGDRFGCFLCDTKAMTSKNAWFQHAFTEKHMQKVAMRKKTEERDPFDQLLEDHERYALRH